MTQARDELRKSIEPFERGRTHERQYETNRQQHPLLHLQRLAGNRAVMHLLESQQFQAKPRSIPRRNVPETFAPNSLAIHPQLTGSQANVSRQDADPIAQRSAPIPPGTFVQRSCASCATGGATCAKCEEDEQLKLQRQTAGDEARVDPVSDGFLSQLGAGQPLDPASLAFFEPRFGRDFSSVRIHTDQRATASARSINALAYTVGSDVVVQQDHFNPNTDAGRQLLGHELTHTIQQASPGFQQKALISDPADAAEREAERVGAAMTKPGAPLRLEANASATAAGIQRQPQDASAGETDAEGPRDAGVPPPIAGVPTTEEDQRQCVARLGGCPEKRDGGNPAAEDIDRYNKECRQELNYTGPDVQPACAAEEKTETEPPPGGNMAHRKLSKADQEAIVTAGGTVSTETGPTFSKDGPRFVLHDTATSFDNASTPVDEEAIHLKRLKAQGNTPVGEGAASYVTEKGAPERTHSTFFSAQRPSASQFERSNDLMDRFTRETTMQQIWSLTDPAEQNAAITKYLALFPNMPAKDIAEETKKAKNNLDSSKSKPSTKTGGDSVVLTTATGAATQICDAVAAKGAAKIAVKDKEAALSSACATMRPVIDARKTRIADTTNVEIIAAKGSDCSLGATKPFSYVPAVYDAVAKLYVLAALEAGQFPEITTHFFLDSITPAGSPGPVTKSQNRCDPRCFDLDLLYSKIAAILHHPAGTTYGNPAVYGTKFGTSNVWWPQNVCGTAHGTAAAPAKSPPKKTPEKKPPAKKKSTSTK